MKIAIFHDFLDQKGGGERLVLETAKNLNADIITAGFDKDILSNLGFKDQKVIVLPSFTTNKRLRDFSAAFAFLNCNFSNSYDFFIFSGALTLFASNKHSPNFFYCHETPEGILKPIFKKFIKNQKNIIANSKRTEQKLLKEFKVKSKIIYPIITTNNFYNKKSKGYWLSVNRLYPRKRIGLQLDVFKLLQNKKLIIIGDYHSRLAEEEYKDFLLKNKSSNVQFALNVTQKELQKLYSECEGFIATSEDEPFGMSVVEAMASGKGVVCVDEGGFRETVIDNKTGFLVNANPSDLVGAVNNVSRDPGRFKIASIEQAKNFDSKIFFKNIKKEINLE